MNGNFDIRANYMADIPKMLEDKATAQPSRAEMEALQIELNMFERDLPARTQAHPSKNSHYGPFS